MTGERLEDEVESLRRENRMLRERLEGIQAREGKAKAAKKRLMKGSFALLVPLFDRQRVVRSFGKLTETVSGYSGAPSEWPTRDEVLVDTRDFMESVVRFMIRRRTIVLIFSLLATAIPAIQIWLVVKQNEIIENQNTFAKTQVFDVVSRSMTEGDRNAKVMTGALLARSDVQFLKDVIYEAFDPEEVLYRKEDLQEAADRRAEDTAFRGNLIRAAVRAVELQHEAGHPADELMSELQPTIQRILADAQFRIVEIIRAGRGVNQLKPALVEEVDNYIAQVGALIRVYGRLARSADEAKAFTRDIQPLLGRLSRLRSLQESIFKTTYVPVMESVLFEFADEPDLDHGRFDLGDRNPRDVLEQAFKRMEKIYERQEVDVASLRTQFTGG